MTKHKKINTRNILCGFYLICGCILTPFTQLKAQYPDVPAPGSSQKDPIILQNAVIHTGTGEVIAKGDLLILNGKIEEIGVINSVFKKSETIDLSGKHIWPALIAPDTRIGLDEIQAVRASNDMSETGEINPHVRAIIAYNTDSRVTPTVRSNGILLAQIAPQGNLFSGTSSVVQLDAWNYQDAGYALDGGLFLNWPSMQINTSPDASPAEEQKKELSKRMEVIESVLNDARSYWLGKSNGKLEQKDARWEAMIPLFENKSKLFIRVDGEKEIRAAVDFAVRQNVKAVIVGGSESFLCAGLLRQYQIPVILGKLHSLPPREDDPVDLSFSVPKMLKESGVLFCLSVNDFWNQRNLSFQAGTAVAYGLSKEDALAAITLNTAKILGIENTTGSLEVGKDANIIVTSGDLLDMKSASVERAFIQGRKVDLSNKQKSLYEKFDGRNR